jgi:hypothetical protein
MSRFLGCIRRIPVRPDDVVEPARNAGLEITHVSNQRLIDITAGHPPRLCPTQGVPNLFENGIHPTRVDIVGVVSPRVFEGEPTTLGRGDNVVDLDRRKLVGLL